MANAATKQEAKVNGMTLASPPSLSKSVVPAFFSTAPAQRNREDLNIALFNMWNKPPAIPTRVPVPIPSTM